MNFKFYLEKLQKSDLFRDFLKNNSDSYICSAFITLDKEGNDNQRHIDLYLPKEDKMISFNVANGVEIIPSQPELNNEFSENKIVIHKLKDIEKIDFDFDDLEDLIVKAMEKNDVKNKLQKILISLQSKDGKNSLVCTIFVSNFGLLKAVIDLDSWKVIDFEKKSFFDLIRKVK